MYMEIFFPRRCRSKVGLSGITRKSRTREESEKSMPMFSLHPKVSVATHCVQSVSFVRSRLDAKTYTLTHKQSNRMGPSRAETMAFVSYLSFYRKYLNFI